MVYIDTENACHSKAIDVIPTRNEHQPITFPVSDRYLQMLMDPYDWGRGKWGN
jgi:hypothetical protein